MRPTLIFITGAPGVGKSTAAWGPFRDLALTRLAESRSMPTLHIDTTGRTPEEIAAELERRVREG